MFISHDATESLRRRVERRRRPPQAQRSALPVLHPTYPISGRRMPVVDQVRRPQTTPELAGQPKTIDREHLFKSFAKRRRRVGMVPLQPGGVLLDLGHPLLRLELEGRLERRLGLFVLVLGQVARHVADPVSYT